MQKLHTPTICILDDNPERCVKSERLLDKAISDKNILAHGISNYGVNYLARTGLESFPAIEVDGLYFTPKVKFDELTYDDICGFLDFLLKKGIITHKK